MFATAVVAVLLGLGAPALSAAGDPVKLTVFYSTLCPDSIRFVTTQLYPVYKELKDYISLDIITYGKANMTAEDGSYSFDCQSGPKECEGNLLINCAQKHISNMDVFMHFSYCIMENKIGAEAGAKCALKSGICAETFNKMEECAMSDEGLNLHMVAGIKQNTLTPPLYYVPWIMINNEFSADTLETAQEDLRMVIADNYQGDDMPDCADNEDM